MLSYVELIYLPAIQPKISIQKNRLFEDLENFILKYREKGDILIRVDLNPRTGREGNMPHKNNKYIAEIAPHNNNKTSLKGGRS